MNQKAFPFGMFMKITLRRKASKKGGRMLKKSSVWRLCLIGFGNVGQGLVRILEEKEKELEKKWGFRFSLAAVVTKTHGASVNLEGLSLSELLRRAERGEPLGTDCLSPEEAVLLPGVDIVIDATPTNLQTGEPGLSFSRKALHAGRSVVTSSKGPLSVAMEELRDLASQNGCTYRFEGSVMSGTPTLSLAMEAMAGCTITSAEGIVNGTTNFLLTRMEEGLEYEEALDEAREKGYAEADPSGDVDGWDAAVKAQILAGVVLGHPLPLGDVQRKGISGITRGDIASALSRGKRIKLVAKAVRQGGSVAASVAPAELPLFHPLASVGGVMNALTFTSDNLPNITIIGPGAGRRETGQAILADMLALAAGRGSLFSSARG